MEYYQLPKEFATKWVSALRSGKFIQIKKCYTNGQKNCFCALGLGYYVQGCHFDYHGIPDDPLNMPITGHLYKTILQMNDVENKSFVEIADFVQQTIELI